ncbi:MAG: YceI family protein [Bacteroidetes bacterium]|nr:YceI family protein [Bacteroidota bacterium]
MNLFSKFRILPAAILMLGALVYMASCRKTEDPPVVIVPPAIVRGTEKVTLVDPKTTHDKSHSNVNWSTPYMGSLSALTGRFNSFGITTFNFDESNAAGINFEGWVYLNTPNTSEPGRDYGCLQTTFGVDTTMREQPANKILIKTKSVTLSTTDKGYIVKFDMTFHGVTKELTGKMFYNGHATSGTGATLKDIYGFAFDFQFLAKTDFLIVSTNIGDQIDVKCDAIFRKTL